MRQSTAKPSQGQSQSPEYSTLPIPRTGAHKPTAELPFYIEESLQRY
jgi:hypothetical protein